MRWAAVALAGCWTTPAPATAPLPTVIDAGLIASLRDPDKVLALIDPAVGLVFVDEFFEPGEPPGTTSSRQLCGDELARFLHADWPREVAQPILHARGNGSIRCDQLACRAGGRGEYDPVYHFDFVRGPRGLTLRSVSYDDEVLVGEDDIRATHAKVAALVARLSVRCR